MALRNHLIHCDELIALQDTRLRGLKEEFDRDVNIIKTEYDGEKNDIEISHNEEKRELQDMIETVKEEEEGKLAKMKEDFESQTVETRNTNVEIMDTMRNALTRRIDDLDTKFDQQF